MFDYLLQLEKFSPLLLGRLAFDKKVVSYAQLLEVLLLLQKNPDSKIGELLVDKRYISQQTLQEILQEQQSFLFVSPKNWPYIPNSVIRASVLFSRRPFGKLTQNILDDYKDISPQESLHKILVEERQILSCADINSFLENLEIVCWLCPNCQRCYYLFNYFPQKSNAMCSVCRTVALLPKDNTKISVHHDEERHVEANNSILTINKTKEIIEIPTIEVQSEIIFEISDFENTSQSTRQQKKIKLKRRDVFGHKKFAKNNIKQVRQKQYLFIVLVTFCALFLYVFLQYIATDSVVSYEEPLIINIDVKTYPRKERNTTTPKITEASKQKYKKIESMLFVPQISRSILMESLSMLESLIQSDSKSVYLADYYNLQSRIFLWLAWTDQGILTDEQKKGLFKKSIDSFEKTLELYKSGNDTNFFLRVMPWMLESTQYQAKHWDKSSQEFYYYNNAHIIVDVTLTLQLIKDLLQK